MTRRASSSFAAPQHLLAWAICREPSEHRRNPIDHTRLRIGPERHRAGKDRCRQGPIRNGAQQASQAEPLLRNAFGGYVNRQVATAALHDVARAINLEESEGVPQ